jgi:hypothetical protein
LRTDLGFNFPNGGGGRHSPRASRTWGRISMPGKITLTALALTVGGLGSLALAPQANAANCDRACLIKLTDTYLAAVTAHDPSKAPLAANVQFVENVKRMKPGEGLWKTASGGPTAFKIYVPDVALQQAGWLGVIQQDGKPVMLALRLKVENGKITQAEHIYAAPGAFPGVKENVVTVRSGLLKEIPAAQRLPEAKLRSIGITYYDALDDNKGSEAPFAADCQRRENGMTTAGDGAGAPPTKDTNPSPIAHDCKGQIDSGSFIYIEHIDNRRMIAADPVTGLAMGMSHFRHSMTNLPYKVKHVDGSTSERNKQNFTNKPFDLPAAHIFKIGPEGQIHEIEAVGFVAPYNVPSGWEGTAYAKSFVQPKGQ